MISSLTLAVTLPGTGLCRSVRGTFSVLAGEVVGTVVVGRTCGTFIFESWV